VYCDFKGNTTVWDPRTKKGIPPGEGVMAIVQVHSEVGYQVETGGDWYVRHPSGNWYACDLSGMLDYLRHNDKAHVLEGRRVDRKYYFKAMKIAQEHLHDWKEKKTGWLPSEIKF
jgi:hypothetical protein